MAALPDHLKSFGAWMRHQYRKDEAEVSPDVRPVLHAQYERSRAEVIAHDIHATVRAACPRGEYRYAVAIEDGSDHWLTLWVKRSPKGEYYVIVPRGPGGWNPHASYHQDGRYHQKSHDMKMLVQQRQPLDQFKGAEHLGSFYGHGPGMAVCNPNAFTAVIRVPGGILEGTRGAVLVDLVEPGCAPAAHHREVSGLQIVAEQTFRDSSPWGGARRSDSARPESGSVRC